LAIGTNAPINVCGWPILAVNLLLVSYPPCLVNAGDMTTPI
jgi:hypothetical protein